MELVSSMNSLFLARRFSRSLIFSCSCISGASSGTSAIFSQTYSACRYFFRLAFSRYASLAIEIIYNLLHRSLTLIRRRDDAAIFVRGPWVSWPCVDADGRAYLWKGGRTRGRFSRVRLCFISRQLMRSA